ncbi:MAG: RAMP superfamily CRISPR-associated protein [bacterium]
MSFDLYADLAGQSKCPDSAELPAGLASGFVDGCTTWFARGELEADKKAGTQKKNDARNCYIKQAVTARLLPDEVAKLIDMRVRIPQLGWLAIEVSFTLQTPWYSKDDRLFHVLDNPVRKDPVFGVPYMSAASWKGVLRWACRMQAGLREHLSNGKRFEDWNDPGWILHLFGNEKRKGQDFHQGASVFYPTWFDKIGFEVINPHDRRRPAGTQPILYEVVPGRRPKADNPQELEDGGKGSLRLLYAPLPGAKQTAQRADFLPRLLEAIEQLLTKYGISAKRTVGWGTAEITTWRGWLKEQEPIEATSREEFQKQLEERLQAEGAR